MPAHSSEEVERLLDLLKTVVKMSGISVSEIERRMEQSAGYLSRLWSGAIGMKLGHVYEILEAIELHPAEFFRLAYPQDPPSPSPTGRRLRDFLARLQGSVARAEPAAVPNQQVQELLSGLRELLAAHAAAAAPPPPPPPP
ncbi:MAG TPA: hypothetical protein VF121_09920, partial [Thermoanaerobaculia bacterium]|nr:hypothetical protein [Thermoanaerobaculia bacterium]